MTRQRGSDRSTDFPTLPGFSLEVAASLAMALFVAFAPAAVASDEDDDPGSVNHSLDGADVGETESLDDADTGRTESLDPADTGRTDSLDAADGGSTDSLHSADTGKTQELDAVDVGRTQAVDSIVPPKSEQQTSRPNGGAAAPDPAPLPPIENGNWEAQAERAKATIAAAEQRLEAANTAYADMIRNDYPRGEERQRIVSERDAAERAVTDARSYYRDIAQRASAAGRPL